MFCVMDGFEFVAAMNGFICPIIGLADTHEAVHTFWGELSLTCQQFSIAGILWKPAITLREPLPPGYTHARSCFFH
jgi:hypothetical protein